MRYYYKNNEGNLYNLKSPDFFNMEGYTELTQKEYQIIIKERESQYEDNRTEEQKELDKEINAHKQYLRSTDYIACKLAEATTEAQEEALRQVYKEELTKRQEARDKINKLEAQAKQLN